MISKSVLETERVARDFTVKIKPQTRATVIALLGDLGSGKTTFTKALAAAFGVPVEEVTSPTFVIQKRFNILNHSHFKNLVHVDAYRLEKPEDMEKLGWKELVSNSTNLIVIEWPENIGAALPKDTQKIFFKFIDDTTREINIK